MLFRLLLLFTIVPTLELVTLLWLADRTSWQFTILVILVTGALGASLARWQGLQTIKKIQRELSQGQLPHTALLDGLMILVAGAVLITPGILTDAVGFFLLMPFGRRLIRSTVARTFQNRFHVSQFGQAAQEFRPEGDRIIDAKIIPNDSSDSPSS